MACISKIGREKYRKSIVIEEKNQRHYVTSVRYEREKDAKKALAVYKKVFTDAFIVEVEQKKAVNIPPHKASSEEVFSAKMVDSQSESAEDKQGQETNISEKFTEETIEAFTPLDAKILLENKTVYICEEEPVSGQKHTMIRMDFKKAYVVYTKQKKDTRSLNIAYSFDKDRVIIPMSGVDFQYKVYKEEKDFLLVQGFINGKKSKIFRYYFDKEAAVSFLAGNQ